MLGDGALDAAFDATWPAETRDQIGGLMFCANGGVGGDRVNASHAIARWNEADIDKAIAQYDALGQPPMFRAMERDVTLIAALEARGFQSKPGAALMTIDVELLSDVPVPDMTVLAHWPPLSIQRELWRAGGYDDARMAVMERADGPKISLLARIDDRAAGSAFVAIEGETAMIHAIEVAPAYRRRGLAGFMLRRAAIWADDAGAATLALAVGTENSAAIATYNRLGFAPAGHYDYYVRP
ncbi:MAG: GNAT family N-acetyltransferase [Paracoccus sp. (in: a-proteobacteria)]|nr:GNAT family N-acetyltransferase [Paracoccus sp. (in: a-proteobacteria)]